MSYKQLFKKANNKNARAGNKTFMLRLPSKEDYCRMSGYLIFGLDNNNIILKAYPNEFCFLIKTQKMLKYKGGN